MKDYRRYHYDENKLIDYGFKKQGHNYIYKKDLLDGDFRIEVIINDILEAKVYDSDTDEEYTNIHLVGKQGKFVQQVKHAYEECIEDVLNHCFVYDYFIFPQSKRLVQKSIMFFQIILSRMVIHLCLEIMISGLDLLCIQIILSF